MRNRLAMGCPAVPHPASPATRATPSASLIQPHPRMGQKVLRIPPKPALAASTAGQPADAPPQPGSSKGRDKLKKKKKDTTTVNAAKPRKLKKRAASDASSDTEIEGNQGNSQEEEFP